MHSYCLNGWCLTLISSQVVILDGKNKVDKEHSHRLIFAQQKVEMDITPPKNKGKFKKKEIIIYFLINDLELNPGVSSINE